MNGSGMDDATLIERLRGEAIRSRPAFDAEAAARVIAAVRGDASAGRLRGSRGPRSAVVVAAGLGVVWAAIWWGDHGRHGDVAGDPSGTLAVGVPAAGLDALPTLDELGADVAGGIGSLAATVVGLPDWRDLAVAELPIVDIWRSGREPGSATGADGSAGPDAPR